MADNASPDIDWTATTFEGNRRRQHEEFLALPFREKIKAIEMLGEMAAWFASRPSCANPNLDRVRPFQAHEQQTSTLSLLKLRVKSPQFDLRVSSPELPVRGVPSLVPSILLCIDIHCQAGAVHNPPTHALP